MSCQTVGRLAPGPEVFRDRITGGGSYSPQTARNRAERPQKRL